MQFDLEGLLRDMFRLVFVASIVSAVLALGVGIFVGWLVF